MALAAENIGAEDAAVIAETWQVGLQLTRPILRLLLLRFAEDNEFMHFLLRTVWL
jgi:hypothetical protein